MATADRQRAITFEEFCAIVDGDQKADLIDGVIYMASPDNTDANDIAGWLYWLLRAFVRQKGLGKVYHSRVAFRINDINAPEPDVAYVRTSRLGAIHRGFIEGSPDLAVEVVSPDSIDRDYEKKRRQYELAGVREYWIVDEIKKEFILLRLVEEAFREVPPKKGILSSRAVPGFWLRPEWLWQSPLPDEMKTLKQILKGHRSK
jgi:Uma2 family endonuclease